ncbi:cell wall-binding repeat-containing protein [Alteribacter lacisalsi]|nr:cell wall-binding repeat-containing protein [Alteribacter lacisalsi]
MSYKKRKLMRARFAMLMIFLLVMTPFATVADQAGAAGNGDIITMKDANEKSAAEKIENSVMTQFETEEFVEVLIEMTEQVDTASVVADLEVNTATTPYQEKMSKRYAVFDALYTTAETTQAELLSTLEAGQEAGTVKDINSFYVMNYVYAEVTKEMAEQLSYRPEVASIQENSWIEADLPEPSTDDVEIQDIGWNIDMVNAPEAWTLGSTGEGITVGVIDTGVQRDHPALQHQYRGYDPETGEYDHEYNFFDAVNGQEEAYDDHNHGTHVAGTVMGAEQNGSNQIGVAPGAKWIAAKGLSATGGGSQADLLASGEWMLAPTSADGTPNPAMAPEIVQNSWGGQPGISEWYRPLVQAWRDAGQFPVWSAGNSGPGAQTVTPPANYPESYAVAAVDSNAALASFSSRGPSNYDGDQKPNISAPGVAIRSAVANGGYANFNGTSMASPHISGAAAILLSFDAGLSVDDLEDMLNDTAEPLTDSQYTSVPNDGYGVGLLDVEAAAEIVAGGMGAITGHVLTGGDDTEPPVIEDYTSFDEAYSGLDIPVYATVSDDVAVTSVVIEVSHEAHDDNAMVEMDRISGDHLHGEYRGEIPYEYVQEPGFEYRIIATDFGGNTTSTDWYDVDVTFGIVPDNYYQDFENNPVGWSLDGDWEWGVPTAGPEPVTGSRLLGTNLDGNYTDGNVSTAMLPPVDMRDQDQGSVRMNHWYDIEQGYDTAMVATSGDYGETWDVQYEFTGQDQEWRNLYVNLDDYANNEAPVLVAFQLQTDVDTNYLGWYLDNVSLVGEDLDAPSAPEDLTAEQSNMGILLDWSASPETDTEGYNVYRSHDDADDFEHIGTTGSTYFHDVDTEGGEEYHYYVTAFDFSGNESEPSETVSATAPFVVVAYYSDFQNDDGGFTEGGVDSTWEWGEPTSGPNEAYVGDNLWATNLSGDYNNNEDSWLMSPEIELGEELSTATLHFAYWKDVETNWDYAYLEVSSDGGETWTEYVEYTGRERVWAHEELSLDGYIGEDIHIRIAFDSDFIINDTGMYIDDFLVLASTDGEPEAATPIERSAAASDKDRTEVGFVTPGNSYEAVTSQMTVTDDSGLPLQATVTSLDTGRTVHTNPMDGSYLMTHPATDGEAITLQADAYGYYSETADVVVEAEETVTQNFMLDPKPRGHIAGEVVNERNGEPIAGATVRVIEDTNVPTATTDEDGEFMIEDVIYGEYTLRVTAENYHPAEVTVEVEGGEVTNVTVELAPFISYDDEIAYDTGNAENAVVLNAAGNGMGVRFTPEGSAEVRGTNIYIWGDDWPVPGGNVTQIAVYETNASGTPTGRAIEPFTVEVERGGWNYIDFGDDAFVTDNDFIITTIQPFAGTQSPGVATDEEQPNAERSYFYIGGSFEPETQYGNFLIRANVGYALEAPVITSPDDWTYTNEDSIEVTGHVQTEAEVTVYNNEDVAAVVDTDEDGHFSAWVDLDEGQNSIYVEATVDSGVSDPSDSVMVIKDTQAPDITIETPEDGMVTNNEVVTVSGTVDEENPDWVTVNGEETELAEDGSFSERIILEEGENTITVEAMDLAGNHAEESVTVYVDLTAPSIDNIQPEDDVHVQPGETVTVSFDSNTEGGDASFVVAIPSAGYGVDHDHRVAMEETEPGHYTGTWTAPEAQFEGGVVEITLEDAAGNKSTAYAEGTITVGEAGPSVDRIYGDNRYETAVQISHEWDSSDVVVLTNATAFADALAGAPLAHHYDAPLLLTNGSILPDVTADEIERLGAERVIVLGGPNVIDHGVVTTLEGMGLNVDRVFGQNRYDTSYEIASYLGDNMDVNGAVVVNGHNFPDALSIGSYAAQHGMPILLTGAGELSGPAGQALDSLGVDEAVIVGGYTAVSQSAEDAISGMGIDVDRLAGDNRYATNIAVTEHFAPDTDHMYVATGLDFADALAGAPLAAQNGSGILLTGSSVHSVTADYISGSDLHHLTIFGGPNAVSEEVQNELRMLLH